MHQIKIEKPNKEKLESIGVKNWTPWECKPSTFDWEYDTDESAYILEGKVRVETEDGQTVEINKGDLVHFPKGLRCRWNVIEKIKKVYTFK